MLLQTDFEVPTCRRRLLEVLSFVEEEGPVVPEALLRMIEETQCAEGHPLPVATVSNFVEMNDRGHLLLNAPGSEWLLEHGRPAAAWGVQSGRLKPLREWQVEALDTWAAHGRTGVVEAVTGTGKSRVGIEAIREAVDDDYTAIVVVPTVELVHQWIRTLRDHGMKSVDEYRPGSWQSTSVVVGTVQRMHAAPPQRFDGKILLVADECHRYGAGEWRRVLGPTYRRRLGLTATFERNDDGLEVLNGYFGGGPVYRIGFDRAIADGVVAAYDLKLLAVELSTSERRRYDEAERVLRDKRIQLLAAGLPAEPFGAFLEAAKEVAEDDEDPTVTDVARAYLKTFSERIDVLSGAQNKITALDHLRAYVEASHGALVFTRRIESAEEITVRLADLGVRATSLHSGLTRTQRRERLSALRAQAVQAVVAPTVLDEGIDVPEVDLGIVMAGSKSRRQMIQRMGRVLRAKADGRKATFIVVYARDTIEDLEQTDGVEGQFDLIVGNAASSERLDLEEHTARGLPGGLGDPEHSNDAPQNLQEGSTSEGDFLHALERLAALYGGGFLTADEFKRAKARLL